VRVLICPLASLGFVFPAIGLAHKLRARGHTVAFVTGLRARPMLERQGLSLVGGGPCFRTQRWHDTASVQEQARVLRHVLEQWPADVLLTSALCLGPLLVGEATQRPVATLGLFAPLWPTDGNDTLRYAELNGAYQRSRAALGLTGPGPDLPLLGQCYLHRGIPGLLPGPMPTQAHPIGAALWEPPVGEPLRRWLADCQRPPIYLHPARTFGSPGFWSNARHLLAARSVAASTGRLDQPRGESPPGWFVRPHVSMGPVLSACAVVVASGTTTAALGALWHGCPAVLLPGGSEQFAIARMLSELGVAEILSAPQLLPAALSRAEARREAAMRLSARYRNVAVDPVGLIEALL